MKTISIINQKGGVGKTTSTVNFASILASKGKKVLVIDIDAQGNTSNMFKCEKDKLIEGIFLNPSDIDIKDTIKTTDYENINIISSSEYLEDTNTALTVHQGGRDPKRRLAIALNKIKDDYDYCIIDCPPALNTLSNNALVASDEVLVPMRIDEFSMSGFQKLIQRITEIKEDYNPQLIFRGCFVTMDCHYGVNKKVKSDLKEQLGDLMLDRSIRQSVKVIESTFYKEPVVKFNKSCNASKDYLALAEDIFKEAF